MSFDVENWTDETNKEDQQTLDVGRESLATADRESKTWGGNSFTDHSTEKRNPGEQSTVSGEKLDGQTDLAGCQAERKPGWDQ